MDQEYLCNMTLLFLLILAMLGKNNSLAISVSGLIFFLLVGRLGGEFEKISQSLLLFLDKHGLQAGLILLVMGILAPFARGGIDMALMMNTLKTYKGIIGIIAGMVVAIFASKGGYLLTIEPTIVTAVVMGTILGIIIFKGYPVGPLIGSGLAYLMIYITEIFIK